MVEGRQLAGRGLMCDTGGMTFQAPISVLRMFDVAMARAFYCDYLGFAVTFEHRFAPDLPLYMGLERGACRLHLSEHHGDATPGSTVRIGVENIDAMAAELAAKAYKYLRPGIQDQPWGLRELTLTDPFGNRIVLFAEP